MLRQKISPNGILEHAIDIGLADRDFVHLPAVWASDFQGCLPSGLEALHIGLDAGGRLLASCWTGKKREAICGSFLYRRERNWSLTHRRLAKSSSSLDGAVADDVGESTPRALSGGVESGIPNCV